MNTFKGTVFFELRLIPKSGDSQKIKGGDIKKFDLRLDSWGWSGSLDFWVFDTIDQQGAQEDKVKELFWKPDLLKIELDVQAGLARTVEQRSELRDIVTLRAIVTKRSVVERELTGGMKHVLARRYSISFADSAQVLWGQHHPCQLYANKSMQDVFQDHLPEGILLQSDGNEALAVLNAITFLALDPSIGKASFYDFAIWWIDRHRLILEYVYGATQETYTLKEKKTDSGTPFIVWKDNVAVDGVKVDIPEVPRYVVNVLDSFTGAKIGPTKVTQDYNVAKIRRDTLLRTPLSNPDFEDRAALERKRLVPDPPVEMSMSFQTVPWAMPFPGDRFEFQKERGWTPETWQMTKSKVVRVTSVRLSGVSWDESPDFTHLYTMGEYNVSLVAQFEAESEKETPRLPAFVEPVYPVYVEATILSEVGATDELTYDPKEQDSGLFAYRVKVPLWEDTVTEIPVPYNPGRMPGQLFFPAYRDERIVLALTWHKAWIDSFIDWRPDARMSEASQANRMLLGKNPKSRTSLTNYYEESGSLLPIFEIARSHESDKQTICISEGNLLIEVKEDQNDSPSNAKVENVVKGKQD